MPMNEEELDQAIHETKEAFDILTKGSKDHPNKVVRDAFAESLPKVRKELDRLEKLKKGQT
jgi:hypothetical protein